jgi:tRNA threonylcarbamoyladenosine biosynthesis protein TsaE
MTDTLTIETSCPEQTETLGATLASLLKSGVVVTLRGDLATGKTCLVRGMAAHFSDAQEVRSPTFTLVNEYGTSTKMYHLDLYRLSGPEEVADLGYEELFDSDGICVVEWAERGEGLFPEERLDIALVHAGHDRRRLTFKNRGILPAGWEDTLSAVVPPRN